MPEAVSPITGRPVREPDPTRRVATGAIFLFGVALPAFTLVFELLTRACAAELFDPVPSVFHAILIASVPVANALVLLAAYRGDPAHRRALLWLNATAVGVSFFYALLFLPIAPLAVIAIVYMGIGLLPLAPLASLVCALVCRRMLRRITPTSPLPSLWPRALVGVLALLLLAAPMSVTKAGLKMAASPDPERRISGIRLLRTVGSTDAMLRMCYPGGPGFAADPIGALVTLGTPATIDQSREIFYRVTGAPFNTHPRPSGRERDLLRILDWDAAIGGTEVADRSAGLSLAQSRMDGSIDADGAVGYLEWTLEFANAGSELAEARAQLELPPGGVVSRVTLWIDGQEREAAFAGRAEARAAYESVVRRQRDPILVTTDGPDRVLMQCYPIGPGGGRMKARLGITFPLDLSDAATGVVALPRMLERNFEVGPSVRHDVWLEGENELLSTAAELEPERPSPGAFAIRGSLPEDALAAGGAVVTARRSPSVTRAWATDPTGAAGAVVQRIAETQVDPAERLVVVVDSSASVEAHAPAIASALEAIRHPSATLVLAGDEIEVVEGDGPALARAVTSAKFAGGTDNGLAIARAWGLAARSPRGVVVWIHGPQPVASAGLGTLSASLARRPDGPRIVDAPVVAGPNRLLEDLEGAASVARLRRAGPFAEDASAMLASLAAPATRLTLARERVAVADPTGAKQTSGHIARLLARDDAAALAARDERPRAIELASAYRIVTPVTGAVVLETAQQYQDAGLAPGSAANVPTVPEPEVWALLLVTAAALAWLLLRRRGAQWRPAV